MRTAVTPKQNMALKDKNHVTYDLFFLESDETFLATPRSKYSKIRSWISQFQPFIQKD